MTPNGPVIKLALNPQVVFGARVRDRRTELGLSQEALAERCELHRTYVGSLERGERNVALLNILRLAAGLEVDPGDLLRELTL